MSDKWLGRATGVAWVGAICAAGAALQEWSYHQNHRYAPGPSLVLAIGFAAAALIGIAAAVIGHAMHAQIERFDRQRASQWEYDSSLRSTVEGMQRELENLRLAVSTNDELHDMLTFIDDEREGDA